MGMQVRDGLALGLFELRVVQAGGERARDAARDFVLRVENRLERHVVAVGPDVMSPLGIDEFRADADRPPRPAHSARHPIAATAPLPAHIGKSSWRARVVPSGYNTVVDAI